jgi:hypothetical protein
MPASGRVGLGGVDVGFEGLSGNLLLDQSITVHDPGRVKTLIDAMIP